MIDFTLPELGENITTGDVLRVLVKPGDTLAKDQPVLELETDKATIEVPSSVEGRIKDVKVKAGEKVKVGQPILSVEDGQTAGKAAPVGEPQPAAETADRPRDESANQPHEEAASQPREEAANQPREEAAVAANTAAKVPEEGGLEQHVEGRQRSSGPDKSGSKKDQAAERSAGRPADRGQDDRKVVDISRGARAPAEPPSDEPAAPAAPSVRRMARELGVEINEVAGSGASGRISIDDVKAHAKRLVSAGSGAARPAGAEPLPDFSRWGEVERQPLRAVRRKTAEHLSAAWSTVPHVTQHDVADITALDELRKRYTKQAEQAGGPLTLTAIAVKVAAAALKVFPQFNASIDLAADEMIYKKYVNVGVAVDTDRGLLVPVIRDANAKNLIQLSVELAELAEKARSRKITLDEMQGGTFSISNLGGIGGTAVLPRVNAPEVAILGTSRARTEAVYVNGELAPRLMLPLSLSYDHRAIDGADGARFLRWIAEAFEQPFVLALQG